MSLVLTLPLLALLALSGETVTTRFGVAVDSHGEACVAIEGHELAEGTGLTVVDPQIPQKVFAARVKMRIPECEALAEADPPGTLYRVSWQEQRPQSPFLGIVVVGAPAVRNDEGTVEFELSKQVRHARVRSCTSQEGVHLSVWSGAPLESTRLWHRYWYLGYEVEPSCEDADFRNEGG